jgi:hypothetical protein
MPASAALLEQLAKKNSAERARIADMPESAEKTLLLMQLLALEINGPDPIAARKNNTCIVGDSLHQWGTLLKLFKTQLLDEQIAVPSLDLLEAKDCPTCNLLPKIEQVQQCVRQLDLALALSLVSQADVVADQLKGRDTILLIGNTGAGKSTTIHFLADTKLHETTLFGVRHIGPAPDAIIAEDLQDVIASPLMKSETRYIHAIRIACNPDLASCGFLTLCDTPGFGDTAGPEVDLANCIGIYRAVRQSSSVRIVLLISANKVGDRFDGLEPLARTLSYFLQDLKRDIASIFYIFTKFSKSAQDEIYSKLCLRLNSLTVAERSKDTPLVIMLEDLERKSRTCKDTAAGVCILDPLSTDRVDVLRNITQLPPIASPADSVKPFISPESMALLNSQLDRDNFSVSRALHDPPNFAFANKKLMQLSGLAKRLELERIHQVYSEGVRALLASARNVSVECDKYWREFAKNPIITPENFARGLTHVHQLIDLEEARAAHLTPEVVEKLGEKLEPFLDCNLRERGLDFIKGFVRLQLSIVHGAQYTLKNMVQQQLVSATAKLSELLKAFEYVLAKTPQAGVGLNATLIDLCTSIKADVESASQHLLDQANCAVHALDNALKDMSMAACLEPLDVLKFAMQSWVHFGTAGGRFQELYEVAVKQAESALLVSVTDSKRALTEAGQPVTSSHILPIVCTEPAIMRVSKPSVAGTGTTLASKLDDRSVREKLASMTEQALTRHSSTTQERTPSMARPSSPVAAPTPPPPQVQQESIYDSIDTRALIRRQYPAASRPSPPQPQPRLVRGSSRAPPPIPPEDDEEPLPPVPSRRPAAPTPPPRLAPKLATDQEQLGDKAGRGLAPTSSPASIGPVADSGDSAPKRPSNVALQANTKIELTPEKRTDSGAATCAPRAVTYMQPLALEEIEKVVKVFLFMKAFAESDAMQRHLPSSLQQENLDSLLDAVSAYLTLLASDVCARSMEDLETNSIAALVTFLQGLQELKLNHIANAIDVWQQISAFVQKAAADATNTSKGLLDKLMLPVRQFGSVVPIVPTFSLDSPVTLNAAATALDGSFEQQLHMTLSHLNRLTLVQRQLAANIEGEGFDAVSEAVRETVAQMLTSFGAIELANFDAVPLRRLGVIMQSLNALAAGCSVCLPAVTGQLETAALPVLQTVCCECDLAARTLSDGDFDAKTVDAALTFLSFSAQYFGRQIPILLEELESGRAAVQRRFGALRDEIDQLLEVVLPHLCATTPGSAEDISLCTQAASELRRCFESLHIFTQLPLATVVSHIAPHISVASANVLTEFCGAKGLLGSFIMHQQTESENIRNVSLLIFKAQAVSELQILDHYLAADCSMRFATLSTELKHAVERISKDISTNVQLGLQSLDLPGLYAAFHQMRLAAVPGDLEKTAAEVDKSIKSFVARFKGEANLVPLCKANSVQLLEIKQKLNALRAIDAAQLMLPADFVDSLGLGEFDQIFIGRHVEIVATITAALKALNFADAEMHLSQGLDALELLLDPSAFAPLAQSDRQLIADALQGLPDVFRATCGAIHLPAFNGVWDELTMDTDCAFALLSCRENSVNADRASNQSAANTSNSYGLSHEPIYGSTRRKAEKVPPPVAPRNRAHAIDQSGTSSSREGKSPVVGPVIWSPRAKSLDNVPALPTTDGSASTPLSEEYQAVFLHKPLQLLIPLELTSKQSAEFAAKLATGEPIEQVVEMCKAASGLPPPLLNASVITSKVSLPNLFEQLDMIKDKTTPRGCSARDYTAASAALNHFFELQLQNLVSALRLCEPTIRKTQLPILEALVAQLPENLRNAVAGPIAHMQRELTELKTQHANVVEAGNTQRNIKGMVGYMSDCMHKRYVQDALGFKRSIDKLLLESIAQFQVDLRNEHFVTLLQTVPSFTEEYESYSKALLECDNQARVKYSYYYQQSCFVDTISGTLKVFLDDFMKQLSQSLSKFKALKLDNGWDYACLDQPCQVLQLFLNLRLTNPDFVIDFLPMLKRHQDQFVTIVRFFNTCDSTFTRALSTRDSVALYQVLSAMKGLKAVLSKVREMLDSMGPPHASAPNGSGSSGSLPGSGSEAGISSGLGGASAVRVSSSLTPAPAPAYMPGMGSGGVAATNAPRIGLAGHPQSSSGTSSGTYGAVGAGGSGDRQAYSSASSARGLGVHTSLATYNPTVYTPSSGYAHSGSGGRHGGGAGYSTNFAYGFVPSVGHSPNLPPQQQTLPPINPLSQQEYDTFTAIRTFAQARLEFSSLLVQLRDGLMQSFTTSLDLATPNASDRDEFFKKLSLNFKPIEEAHLYVDLVDATTFKLDTAKKECVTFLQDEVSSLRERLLAALDHQKPQCLLLLTDATALSTESKQFDRQFCVLRACSAHFSVQAVAQEASNAMRNVQTQLAQELGQLNNRFLDHCDANDTSAAADLLVRMKIMSCNMINFAATVDQRINDALGLLLRKKVGAAVIGKLGLVLDSHPNKAVAQSIISEQSAFRGYSTHLRNQKTNAVSVDHVLDPSGPSALQAKDEKLDFAFLRTQYDLFDKEYWGIVKQRLELQSFDLKAELHSIVADTVRVAAQPLDPVATPRSLMAHVFAYWTIEHSEHYFQAKTSGASATDAGGEASGDGDQKSFLTQPHAAQILAIFRMLGLDKPIVAAPAKGLFERVKTSLAGLLVRVDPPAALHMLSRLDFQLVQILTGEGKSVTLAVTSTVLALLGFDVDCACYSNYLSQRDRKAFQTMFTGFGVDKSIKYGTFNKLCEELINQQGNVRSLVADVVLQAKCDKVSAESTRSTRRRVLLIDEVDVFFSREFYGKTYCPMAPLVDATIAALIKYVWSKRSDKKALTFAAVRKTPQYEAVLQRFQTFEELIVSCVRYMLADLQTFESHDYIEKDGVIYYKEQDGLSCNIQYGYKTMFAYMKEHELNKVQASVLEKKLAFTLDCGNFSYAQLPKEYDCLMGVTGTLKTLSEPELSLLQNEFHINKFTYIPSMYGANQLDFKPNGERAIIIEEGPHFFNSIHKEIEARLKGDTRAVLVFFGSTPKLREFLNSAPMKPLKSFVQTITEETSDESKVGLVRQACTAGMITLLSREFGRGTDFVCYDSTVSDNGGLHVIQTFVSEHVSEETQIKGRTARQGDQGSYSMVLLKSDLDKFMSMEEIECMMKADRWYDEIHQKRAKYFESNYATTMQFNEQVATEHAASINFLGSLWAGSLPDVAAFLRERNMCTVVSAAPPSSRTICLMDATGSMSNLLAKAKNTVGVMFARAFDILQSNPATASMVFELQFAVYRNYNCNADQILCFSPWSSRPDELRTFMDSISVAGGLGNEAVEIGFWHCNREAERALESGEAEPVTQVLLIGDMPPNTREEVIRNRESHFGESYWQSTQFAERTYYMDELQTLRERDVTIHSFFVDRSAEVAFRGIAEATGGECDFLDVQSDSGAQRLTDLMTSRILNDVGGEDYGAQLVTAYRAKYGFVSC